MENYQLKENEVVLYKGNIILNKNIWQLILTNLNLVFIDKSNEGQSNAEIYSVNEIKVYENNPQIKTRGNIVEIYLLSTEKEFEFNKKSEMHKFLDNANKLLTGKSKFQRGVEKIKEGIDIIDNTFNVNSLQIAGDFIKNGITSPIEKRLGAIGKGIKSIGNKKEKQRINKGD